MSTLLIKLFGNRSMNRTLLRPKLFVYSDKVVYKKRHIFSHEEISLTYNHIVQVNLRKIIIYFAHIEIHSSSGDKIVVRWVPKREAVKAKQIIDQKIYQAHVGAWEKEDPTSRHSEVSGIEKSIQRLEELLKRGRISQREFEKRKSQLI